MKKTTKFLSNIYCYSNLIAFNQCRYEARKQFLPQVNAFKKSMHFFLKYPLRILRIPKKYGLQFLILFISLQLSSQVNPLNVGQNVAYFEKALGYEVADSLKFQSLIDKINDSYSFYSDFPFTDLKKGIALATSKNEIEWRGKLYLELGNLYSRLVKKDSAEICHELALLDFKEVQNTQKIIDTHNTLSQMYGSNDQMDKALEHAYAIIAICEKTGDKNNLARAHLNIAGTLNNLGEPKRSIPFAKKALAIYKEINELYGQADASIYLAIYYTDSLDRASFYLNNAYHLFKNNPEIDKTSSWIHYYCNRAIISKRRKDYIAEANDLKLIDSLSTKDRGLSMTHYLDFNKAVNTFNRGKYKEARNLFLKNITDSLSARNPYLFYNYEYLTENYIKLNRWDSAYHYHMIIHNIEATEKRHVSKQNMEALKTQYETGKKETTILVQNQQIKQQRINQWLVIGFASLLGLLLFQSVKNVKIKSKANNKLQELNILKTRFYANITHEFRTPLTVIGGMAAEIQENPEKRNNERLAMIQRNTNRLLNLVNQMLDLSKLEDGKLRLENQQGDFIFYLSYLIESIDSLAKSKKIQIHFQTSVEQIMMDYDPEKMQQIIVNLLSNAVKFTPENGHIYVIASTHFKKENRRKKQLLQLKVKDTGIGIPKEQLPYIFDRFHQVDSSTTRSNEGSGIGLALVKELVKLMEGEISVSSNSGSQQIDKGTEFTLQLPISNIAPKITLDSTISIYQKMTINDSIDKVISLEKEERHLLVDPNKPRVLLVEDNPDVVTYIASCLQDQYEILMANNGQEGINTAIENIPDLIITDVMMPIKDGYEVCNALKNDERTSHIPIIMLTAKTDIESKLTGLEKGVDAYLDKPFHKKELLVRIKKLLEIRIKLQDYYLSIAATNKTTPVEEDLPKISTADNQFIIKLKKVVELHLSDFDFTVERICKEMGMSHSQLHRKTTALTGLSPNKFIRFIRLDKAKTMLKNPDMNISEVAYNLGFSDPSYFGRVFKKELDMTPIQWRELK